MTYGQPWTTSVLRERSRVALAFITGALVLLRSTGYLAAKAVMGGQRLTAAFWSALGLLTYWSWLGCPLLLMLSNLAATSFLDKADKNELSLAFRRAGCGVPLTFSLRANQVVTVCCLIVRLYCEAAVITYPQHWMSVSSWWGETAEEILYPLAIRMPDGDIWNPVVAMMQAEARRAFLAETTDPCFVVVQMVLVALWRHLV